MSSVSSCLDTVPFGTVGGEVISLAEALRLLKLDFSEAGGHRAADWPAAVVERVVIQQAAQELDLELSDEETQRMTDEFRRARKLHSAAATTRYLETRGCTVDDFAEAMELCWIEERVRRRYAEDGVDRHFSQHTVEYDAAVLSELVVEDEGVALELALQLREEGADFARLVRHYSTGPSRDAAGFIGEVRRSALRAPEAAAIFAAEAEAVVGPFPHGRQFRLLWAHSVRRAVLTDAVRQEIAEQLWREWLGQRIRAAGVEITILGEL